MAISFVGKREGTTSAGSSIPVLAGDLLVAFAYRGDAATAITQPTGWTNLSNGAANTNAHRLAYRQITADGSFSSGTWTGAQQLIIHHYRGADGVGENTQTTGAGTDVVYLGLNTGTDGVHDGTESWVAAFAGIRSATRALETPPAGMVSRSNVVGSSSEAAGHDTNAPVGASSEYADTLVTVAGGFRWRSVTLEIYSAGGSAPPAPVLSPFLGAEFYG